MLTKLFYDSFPLLIEIKLQRKDQRMALLILEDKTESERIPLLRMNL
jgi:hypothetical protein